MLMIKACSWVVPITLKKESESQYYAPDVLNKKQIKVIRTAMKSHFVTMWPIYPQKPRFSIFLDSISIDLL